MSKTVYISDYRRVFVLPRQDWEGVKQRLQWCEATWGERVFRGPWEYNAVHHDVTIRGEANCMLYALRWA